MVCGVCVCADVYRVGCKPHILTGGITEGLSHRQGTSSVQQVMIRDMHSVARSPVRGR